MRQLLAQNSILFILFFVIDTSFADSEKVKFGADDWCPFTCDSRLDEKPGIITEVVHEALIQSGLEMHYENVSWARAIKLAEDQKLNGLLGAYLSDLPHFLHPIRPIITSRDCFFVSSQDSWKYKDKISFEKRRIGIIKDYGYGEIIDLEKKRGRNKNFFEVTGSDPLNQNLKKIAAGRVDTILENEMVINYLKTTGRAKDLKSAGCLEDKDIYVVFNPHDPNNKNYITAVDRFLKDHPEKVKAIAEKYRIK